MTEGLSLRGRLTLMILIPLITIAAIVGAWAYRDAQRNAAERFDRSLLSTALAISRDTVASGGDALSEYTRDLLRDTSGGAVFYHIYAPNGVFVTGYATPPVLPVAGDSEATQTYYDADYRGDPVRALRFRQRTSIDGLSGLFTFTVWQKTAVRNGFVRTRTIPVFAIIASLLGALAVIVWFGVARGLAPLTSLEEAIARRSVDDMSPIKRRIPKEVLGIVERFNALLSELSASMDAKDNFISDAAHQLRNPIAGVLALADSVVHAKDLATAKTRANDLQHAAREIGDLTNSLLALERAKAASFEPSSAPFDAIAILRSLAQKTEGQAGGRGVRFAATLPEQSHMLRGDPVMFEQAVLNVLTNALTHGGPDLSSVQMEVRQTPTALQIIISDDGQGIAPENYQNALGRFSQIGPSAGSGLGLPIAAASLASFGGSIGFSTKDTRFCVEMIFPRPRPAA